MPTICYKMLIECSINANCHPSFLEYIGPMIDEESRTMTFNFIITDPLHKRYESTAAILKEW